MTEPRMWRTRWAAVGAAVAVSLGGGGVWWASAATSSEGHTVTIDPVRIVDTRSDLGGGPYVSPVPRDVQVTGVIPTVDGDQTVVPTGATGVVVNVTVALPTHAGFVSVRPADATGEPTTSNLNFDAGETFTNLVIVAVPVGGDDDGNVEITYNAPGATGATTHVIVDVFGYITEAVNGGSGPRAGASFSGQLNEVVELAMSPTIVHDVRIDAPTIGYAIVTANGSVRFGSTDDPDLVTYDEGRCVITRSETGIENAAAFFFDDFRTEDSSEVRPFSSTRFLPVPAGPTTIRLLCETLAGHVTVVNTQMTVIWVPEFYP